jgi:hypothetical protein
VARNEDGVTANGRHLGGIKSGRRGTPAEWVEMARVALGGRIGLDPMSESIFNQVVRAEKILCEKDDCFKHSWECGTLFINPHGGLVVQAWRRMLSEQVIHGFAAIWIGFSVEQLALLADEPNHPDDFSKLTVRDRIDFTTTEPLRAVVGITAGVGHLLSCHHTISVTAKKHRIAKALRCPHCEPCAPEPIGAPTHSNYVVGIGIDPDIFELAFAGRGRFSHGRYALPRQENLFGAP